MSDTVGTVTLRSILKSQYHAGLAMLREAVERCPEDLWQSREQRNAFWQIAYHALFYTHLYLQPEVAAFRPWEHHQPEVQNLGGTAGASGPGGKPTLAPDPYSRTQVLEYWSHCDGMVDSAVDALDLGKASSGFPWYQVSKLEHQLVNLRHLQHHAAQLADRLRAATDTGVAWVGARPAAGETTG
jgi:hypothetical protein